MPDDGPSGGPPTTEQIVGGYRPDADDSGLDEPWERQLGSLATEDLLAIRDQVQALLESVTTQLAPEQVCASGLVAAEELLRRFQPPDSPVGLVDGAAAL